MGPLVCLIPFETVCDDGFTLGGGKQSIPQADDATRWNAEFQYGPIGLFVQYS